jgi:hypothetical protein
MTIKAPRYQADQLPDLRAELVRGYNHRTADSRIKAAYLVAIGLLDLCEQLAAQLAELRGKAQDYVV